MQRQLLAVEQQEETLQALAAMAESRLTPALCGRVASAAELRGRVDVLLEQGRAARAQLGRALEEALRKVRREMVV